MEALVSILSAAARRTANGMPRFALAAALFALAPLAAHAQFVTGLAGASGSTIGPDGAIYVTEGAVGRVSRVDPQTGDVTTFASGLPAFIIGVGGAIDIAFLDGKAYVLVTLVGPDTALVGAPAGTDTVGIYRIDGPSDFEVIADIGTWSTDNPSNSAIIFPSGVQYAIDAFRGGLLVTDGHHNRVLWVTLDGEITELQPFDNVVPTGIEVWGHRVLIAEAGPVPHDPADGRVVQIGPRTNGIVEVAAGARLAVDVEFGPGRSLFALSQGEWDGGFAGSAALPGTGALFRVNGDGTMMQVLDGLSLPTSIEFIGNTAYVVNLLGEIWKFDNVSSPPNGIAR